jgi:hypothetical protein
MSLAEGILDRTLLTARERRGIGATVWGKMDVRGGFIVDAHFPIPTYDACWESIIDLLLVGESATSDSMLTAIDYVLRGQLDGGGWPVSDTMTSIHDFTTAQMLEILVIFRGSDSASIGERVQAGIQAATTCLLSSQHSEGYWVLGGSPSLAITARCVLALKFASALTPDAARRALSWMSVHFSAASQDEFECVKLWGPDYSVQINSPRVYRYSHCTRALAVLAIVELHKDSGGYEDFERWVTRVLDDQVDGCWPDGFSRCDSADGRILWDGPQYRSPDFLPHSASPRLPVWPLFYNLAVLSAWSENERPAARSGSRKGPLGLHLPVQGH